MNYRAGFIGLIGIPNAGKSTLVNSLIGEKISIVSKKPQTTRKRITGILTEDDFQAIFVDAPGVIRNDKGLNSFLIEEYRGVIKDSDALLAILNVDAESPEPIENILELVKNAKKPWAAVVTKKDLGLGHRASVIRTKLEILEVPVIEISALKDPEQARQKIKQVIKTLLPESPAPLYDDDVYTTEKVRYIAGEMVREKCFEMLFEEIPYDLAVLVRQFEELPGLVRIHADLVVEKESHKKIVIGQKGQMLKQIGMQARKDMEKMLNKKVYLELHVSVKKNWIKNPQLMEELGYVVQQN